MASGYFNPLHEGHLDYLEAAKALGDWLIVVINTDDQVKIKGSVPFMRQDVRIRLVGALDCVDDTFLSVDHTKSQIETLKHLRPNIYAVGGDKNPDNVPERFICEELGIEIVYGVGGEKVESSSALKDNVVKNVQQAQ